MSTSIVHLFPVRAWLCGALVVGTIGCIPAADITHRFIACGHATKDITITNAAGEIEWSQPSAGHCNDLTYLPNGNVVWAHTNGASEVTSDHKIVWDYVGPKGTEIHCAQPLPDHRVLIMQCGIPAKLLEIDRRTNAIVKELIIPTPVTNVHNQFRSIRKTPAGTYLVPHLSEKKLVEYNPDGSVLRTFPAEKSFIATRLPNGHTLISGGDAHYISEVDADGKEIWRVNEKDLPGNQLLYVTSLQRLPNGNTVVANWPGHNGGLKGKQPQVFELTPDKKIVWQFQEWQKHGMFSSVQILDTPTLIESAIR